MNIKKILATLVLLPAIAFAWEPTKTVTVIYKPKVNVVPPPIVSLMTPSTSNNQSVNVNYFFKFKILNITSSSDACCNLKNTLLS